MILERNEPLWLNSSVLVIRLNVMPCSGHLCALTLKVNGSSSCILRNDPPASCHLKDKPTGVDSPS